MTERTEQVDLAMDPAAVGVWRGPAGAVAAALPAGVEPVVRGVWGYASVCDVQRGGRWVRRHRVLAQAMTRRIDVRRGWWTVGEQAITAPGGGAVVSRPSYRTFPLPAAARRFLLERPLALAGGDGVLAVQRWRWEWAGAEAVEGEGWSCPLVNGAAVGWHWEGGWRGVQVGAATEERWTEPLLVAPAARRAPRRRVRGAAVGV